MKRLIRIISVLLLVIALSATSVIPFTQAYVVAATKVTISKKSVALEVGKSVTLKLTGTTKSISWKSSNKSVAAVSSLGKGSAKVVGKKAGIATITATVDKKSYTCKVTVKSAANPYLKAAPFDAVEQKMGKLSYVVPKDWFYRLIEDTDESGKPNGYYLVTIAPDENQTSYINVSFRITGEKAEDYKNLKENLSASFTAESIKEMMEAAYHKKATVKDYKTEDFTTDLCTAFRTEYTLTMDGVSTKFFTYEFSLDNYYFSVTVCNTEDIDIDSVAQYFVRSIVIN